MILNNDMEDMTIRYMWPGLGWLQGTISEYMGGDDVADPEGEQVYKVWFDDDGEDQGDVCRPVPCPRSVRENLLVG